MLIIMLSTDRVFFFEAKLIRTIVNADMWMLFQDKQMLTI